MKSYIFSIPERLRNKSHSLDAQAILCGKSWEVFNDEGVKQIFIFQEDGSLLIAINGDTVKASWKYIQANHSILIDEGSKATMLHPAFVENTILALQKDGTNEMVFLIDEFDKTEIHQRSLEGLNNYFAEKELLAYLESDEYKEIQKEEREKLEAKEKEEREKLEAKEKEEREKLKAKEKEKIVDCLVEHKNEIIKRKRNRNVMILISTLILLSLAVTFAITANKPFSALFFTLYFIFFVIFLVILSNSESVHVEVVKKHIKLRYSSDYDVDTIYEETKKTW